MLGIIYDAVEYTIGGKTSGCHDSLRSVADKCLARALNSQRLPEMIIDVGSKYMVMNKLLNYKNHHAAMNAPAVGWVQPSGPDHMILEPSYWRSY